MTTDTSDKTTLCVDFDGVVHSYTSGWKGVDTVADEPNPGAVHWLCWAVDRYQVCIYSSRSKTIPGRVAMQCAIRRWLGEAGLSEWQTKDIMAKLLFPTQKPAAFLTIDDRCICFNGTFPTAEQIDSFKPWNQK
jgi:hypothetical protein